MLEKIGLPPKPSMRGGNWVVDASHCQGCSSQFTFINRKHHCRRCGGLFCNSCTQQRMILRGQGDSPVRICDPCKKLEDAARFELRYGHKNRSAKGTSKQVQKQEEEVLHQILGIDGKQESQADMLSDLLRTASTSSSSSLKEEPSALGREGDFQIDIGSNNPAELRQQAVEEKKKYRILKGEGKSEEALQAFKHGKELERQAGALEIQLRKNRRMASKTSNLTIMASNQKKDEAEESSNKKKLPSQRSKEEKNDLAAELRELGWSDADLHDAEKKPVNLSLEGELSNLIVENTPSSSVSRKTGIDMSQVVALKKKALQLKREGKLAEAKEELKRAKILEKQLEEQELLGEAEDSDDELSALIRSMDDDKHDDLLLDHAPIPVINFEHILCVGDELTLDDNFDRTDNDMNDPELAAALKSFGWTEEDDEQAAYHLLESNPLDREALQQEVLSLKREALGKKREGNVAEAMSLLKKAKLLEKDLETMQVNVPKSSISQVSQGRSRHQESEEEHATKLPAKSKLAIQKELLALKKKALALRREGRVEEADEELKKGKSLEQQLEEMENAPKRPGPKMGMKNSEINHIHGGVHGAMDLGEEGAEAEVTELDMHDPALMSVLKNLGWNDDDTEPVDMKSSKLNDIPSALPRRSKAEIQRELLGLKRKALALRRQGKTEEADEELERARDLEKQLADMEASSNSRTIAAESHDLGPFVPQDKSDTSPEADRDSLALLMGRKLKEREIDSKGNNKSIPLPTSSVSVPGVTRIDWEALGKPGVQSEEDSTKSISSMPRSDGGDFFSNNDTAVLQSTVKRAKTSNSHADGFSPPTAPIQPNSRMSAQQNAGRESEASPKSVSPEQSTSHGMDSQKDKILAHKRMAVALKREGKLAEAREELRRAKLLENSLEGEPLQSDVGNTGASVSTSESTSAVQETRTNQQVPKLLSGRDRFKLQQESLAHKRNALKLRREGKIEESEAELELAKALENQLEESGNQGSNTSAHGGKLEGMGDMGVEDLLDPQLVSALKSVGWEDSALGAQTSQKPDPKLTTDKGGNTQGERTHLEEMIKAEKVRALNLKREGKQAEALEALRSAKRLEKKLGSLTQ